MKQDGTTGAAHPMTLKKDLARRIVADFHTPEAAAKAGEDWARQFQKDEVPESVEEVALSLMEVGGLVQSSVDPVVEGMGYPIRVDKLVAKLGLTASTSEAVRKIKERAVYIDGELVTAHLIHRGPPVGQYCEIFVVRVGRKAKKAVVRR